VSTTTEPTDEDLHEFVRSLLTNLEQLSAPDVIEEAIRQHRAMWILLYRASQGFDGTGA
jgi:hypothetical protein